MRRWVRRVKKLEQNLADLQTALTALLKRFGLILAALAALWAVVWPHMQKLPDRINEGQTEIIEDTPGERVYRVRGGQAPPEEK
jgi:hypothetical protein